MIVQQLVCDESQNARFDHRHMTRFSPLGICFSSDVVFGVTTVANNVYCNSISGLYSVTR